MLGFKLPLLLKSGDLEAADSETVASECNKMITNEITKIQAAEEVETKL